MEWVEVTGKTVEDAKDAALDQLGVDEAEAEFEVLEEPRAGLFGRLRSEARVRARVMPSVPRPKVDRRERRRGRRPRGGEAAGDSGGGAGGSVAAGDRGEAGVAGGDGGDEDVEANGGQTGGGERRGVGRGRRGGRGAGSRGGQRGGTAVSDPDVIETDMDEDEEEEGDEVEVAESFLSGLLDRFGAPYQVERRELEDDLVELAVHGDGLGLLIGPKGQTLAAVQELTRTVVQRRSRGRSSRIVLDIAGYRQARRAALERFAGEVADQVRASGVPRVLEPMPPADRKVVHDAINVLEGVTTSSEGEEPRRRVVISPAGGAGASTPPSS